MGSPICRNQQTPDGTRCVVKPYGGSGHVVADPYVYIDPAWQYASWFKLETASDDTDTSWSRLNAPPSTP